MGSQHPCELAALGIRTFAGLDPQKCKRPVTANSGQYHRRLKNAKLNCLINKFTRFHLSKFLYSVALFDLMIETLISLACAS